MDETLPRVDLVEQKRGWFLWLLTILMMTGGGEVFAIVLFGRDGKTYTVDHRVVERYQASVIAKKVHADLHGLEAEDFCLKYRVPMSALRGR